MGSVEGRPENPRPKDRKLKGKELHEAAVTLRGELSRNFAVGETDFRSRIVRPTANGRTELITHHEMHEGLGTSYVEAKVFNSSEEWILYEQAIVSVINGAPDSISYTTNSDSFEDSERAVTGIREFFRNISDKFTPFIMLAPEDE